jgi:uncharacterized repeat protein (TIGR03803 family)
MPSQAQRPISVYCTIVMAGVTTLLITAAASPMSAQSSVPPTASHAATTPNFAPRPALPSGRPALPPYVSSARQASPGGPPPPVLLYENGPIDGNTYAWEIDSSNGLNNVVSDTFTLTGSATITGISFGAWLYPGDTLDSAQVIISSEPNNSGTIYYNSQPLNFVQTGCALNQYGYNVCTETVTLPDWVIPELSPGTYWMNLQNAYVPYFNPVFWDQNSGVGCMSPGCPSQAQSTYVGTIPSESFTLVGNSSPPLQCFQPHGNLQVLYNFTQQQAGTSGQDGVVIDRGGNLYGAFPNGGEHSAGFVFKLTHSADWVFNPLFSFAGGSTGGQPTGLIVGPNGSLYGGAQGGIQNCGTDGSQYCGLVFNLRPRPTVCPTSQCSWTESMPYRFTNESDGSGTINVTAFDQQGNLYGTTSTGGALGGGTVFELTPSADGWTKTTLFSFDPRNVDSGPAKVLVGTDGNLYGISNGLDNGTYGVVFQLSPSNGQWTETILLDFQPGAPPLDLGQDSYGNLYGSIFYEPFAGIKSGSGFDFSFFGYPIGTLNNLLVDAEGNLYGTALTTGSGLYIPFIYKAWFKNESLEYLDIFNYQSFPAGGTLALDTMNGNLYGTTNACGTNNAGTVWQLSP